MEGQKKDFRKELMEKDLIQLNSITLKNTEENIENSYSQLQELKTISVESFFMKKQLNSQQKMATIS